MIMNLWPCSPAEARENFFLTPDGELRFKKWPDRPINGKAKKGVVTVMCDGRTFNVARTIWCLHYGEWPDYNLRHIDGDLRNNKLSNLELNLKSPIRGFWETKRALENDALFLAARNKTLFSKNASQGQKSEM